MRRQRGMDLNVLYDFQGDLEDEKFNFLPKRQQRNVVLSDFLLAATLFVIYCFTSEQQILLPFYKNLSSI